jgi:DNA-binding NarL/FixJ family response regulator
MTEPGNSTNHYEVAPPKFLTSAEWTAVIRSLHLAPQQVRVVALILQGKKDKQIAQALGVKVATVRTHLGRLFARVGVADRVELILHVFWLCRALSACPQDHCPQVRGQQKC